MVSHCHEIEILFSIEIGLLSELQLCAMFKKGIFCSKKAQIKVESQIIGHKLRYLMKAVPVM